VSVHRAHRPLLHAAAVIALLALACARGMSVGTPARETYAVLVENTLETEMIVSYDAGSGPRALGTVTPGATERFVIALPEPGTVTITAQDSNGTRTVGPFSVDLVAGSVPTVTLRQGPLPGASRAERLFPDASVA
jgi:hypothetical protein